MPAVRNPPLQSEVARVGGEPPPVHETIVEMHRDGTWSRAFALSADGTTQARAANLEPDAELLPPPVHDLVKAAVRGVLDTGRREVVEYAVELDGERRELLCRITALCAERALCVITDITSDRRHEEALRLSEAGFRQIIEYAPDPLIVLDENSRIMIVNRATCSSLGYDEDTLLRMHLRDITPRAPPIEAFERWKARGDMKPLLLEAKHVRRDGSTFDVEVHVRRAVFRGAPSYVAFARDITQRKRVAEALRRSEATMRSLVEHAPAVIVVSDLEGRARFVSGDLAGWGRARLTGKRMSTLLTAGGAEDLERALECIRVSGQREDVEVCMPDPEGAEVWLSVRIARVDAGDGPPTLIHIVQDVTEARRIREALRASEVRFRQLVEQAVDGIYVFDAEGRIVDANTRGCASLGFDHADLVGRPITFPSPDLVLGEVLDECRRLPPRGSITFETMHARRDGRTFPVELRVGRLEAGGPARFVALARDVSDRQNLERAALDAIEREQRRFGRDLHDGLGQDLAGIAFLAKALEGTLAAAGRPEAVRAAEIANRVAATIAQTRAMAHGLAPVGVHGDELVMALEALASDTTTVFGVRCRVQAQVDVRGLDASIATTLYRIAQEAVTNALRHARASEIVLCLQISAAGASLRILDDGLGIASPAERPDGLGLQIMALRARRLGGRLEVRAEPAGGTAVVCVVPPCRAGHSAPQVRSNPDSSPTRAAADGGRDSDLL
jgi:two-component system, LuxR family, sensor kinase FixL